MATKFVKRIKHVMLRININYKLDKVELDSCETNYDGKRFNYKGTDIMVIDVNLNGVTYIKDFYANEPEEFLLTWEEMYDLDDSFLEVIYDNLMGTFHNEIK